MRLARGILAALAGVALAVMAGGPAQAVNGVFKGAKSARILVGDLTDDARACGLSRDMVLALVKGALGTTNLLIDAPGNPDFSLYVDVATVRTPGGDCVSSMAVKAANHEDVKFTFSRVKRSFQVVLFDETDLWVSGAAAHADTVASGLGQVLGKFASDYDLDTRW